MDRDISNLLIGSFSVLIVGGGALLYLVVKKLAPSSGLSGRAKWLMVGAFSFALVAITVKLTAIGVLSTIQPRALLEMTSAANLQPMPVNDEKNTDVFRGSQVFTTRPVWQALPDTAPAPEDNPTTPEKVMLGRLLFFDVNLSRDRTVACASCHDIFGLAGGDARPTSVGIKHQRGGRNAPTVWNAAFQARLFWDGRAASLEEQAKGPPVAAKEMGMPSLDAVAERVRENPEYRVQFAKVFGNNAPITIDEIAKAIAAYERTLITPDTPYDRFIKGDSKVLTAAQLRGMALFQSAGCIHCHSGPNFSGASVFDDQAPFRAFPSNPVPYYEARYHLLDDRGADPTAARGVWRVPSLRNVALTGPYLHNGSVRDLAEVVRIMSSAQLGMPRVGTASPQLVGYFSEREKMMNNVEHTALRDDEVNDIVAFLKALSSDSLAARARKGVPK
jgi:cytochrome c peroxidase